VGGPYTKGKWLGAVGEKTKGVKAKRAKKKNEQLKKKQAGGGTEVGPGKKTPKPGPRLGVQ